jgi:hypothetical protein
MSLADMMISARELIRLFDGQESKGLTFQHAERWDGYELRR